MAYEDTKGKWLYDIFLDDNYVGDQGNEAFDTREDAEIDANHYLEQVLVAEYGRSADDFVIEYYQGAY